MNAYNNEELNAIREGVRALCAEFPAEYWRKIDEEKGFPEAFVKAMTDAGWLSAMIPEEYGGSGLGLAIARTVAQRHGGEMRVSVGPEGRGLAVTMELAGTGAPSSHAGKP